MFRMLRHYYGEIIREIRCKIDFRNYSTRDINFMIMLVCFLFLRKKNSLKVTLY